MAENGTRTYRIRTNVGYNESTSDNFVNVQLKQDYDCFEILSLKIGQEGAYRLHNSNYGVIVGRVIANNGFGVPNCKVSIFISADTENTSEEMSYIYGYANTSSTDHNGIRYNLLPNEKVNDCHKAVGTFPTKRYLLDNDVEMEVFDKYYTLTTRTNESGDYMLCGVPTGNNSIHMDCDLSDCGMLSQRPRDMVYKGYNINQFDSANEFKTDTRLDSLKQILSQDQSVYVNPFWGNDELGETIGITRCDINLTYKFEPTCVFIGSVVGDNASNGLSKTCIPTNKMGSMDEMTTGEGRIEMIRKTMSGEIESFPIKGTQLIDGNGTWCYQIPMNLDYVVTDEYGKLTPTDDPEKGIPTRTSVRFRVSMSDFDGSSDKYLRAKVLVPHNPQDISASAHKPTNSGEIGLDYVESVEHEDYDYAFGTNTRDESFRDMFWNNVYTVKQYIPRFQYSSSYRNERFTGIKGCNYFGNNNPMPYNNIRIKMPLMFTILCALIKAYVFILKCYNTFMYLYMKLVIFLCNFVPSATRDKFIDGVLLKTSLGAVSDGLCPDLENWYFVPYSKCNIFGKAVYNETTGKIKEANIYECIDDEEHLLDTYTVDDRAEKVAKLDLYKQTIETQLELDSSQIDKKSIDNGNSESESEGVCLTTNTDYLISCIEMNLAQEYRVINFDFYNDWINGVLYFPRWMMDYRPKRKYLFGLIKIKAKTKGCIADRKIFGRSRNYIQQCSIRYSRTPESNGAFLNVASQFGCYDDEKGLQRCHKGAGMDKERVFGTNGGAIKQEETMLGENVYYYKPCEWKKMWITNKDGVKVNLYATDIVLLGSLNDCSTYGIPQAFKYMESSSYKMPTNLALTNMDNDSYMYGTQDGTYCVGKASEISISGVSRVDNTYSATQTYYSTLSTSDEYIAYSVTGTDEKKPENLHDAYPYTEAAGISWNYTGPGQVISAFTTGDLSYSPGGHFLGLSCTNSDTNLKSCLNLQRICEMGVEMSQRRTEIRKITGSGGTDFEYDYYAPTGLISNVDITSPSFRSMFATMNMKPLIADSIDEETGYKKYSFVYENPNGFNGEMNAKVSTGKSGTFPYNGTIDMAYAVEDIATLSGDGVDVSYYQEGNPGYREITNTFTKTIETENLYYYMFRLGLSDLSNTALTMSRYYYYRGYDDRPSKPENKKYFISMPQYQNSFYFYFGLKDGSTAFDRFRSEFYSECDSENNTNSDAYVVITKNGTNKQFNNSITCSVYNAIPTYTYKLLTTSGDIELTGASNESTFKINGIDAGEYTLVITDGNGYKLTTEVKIEMPSLFMAYDTDDITYRIRGTEIGDEQNDFNRGREIINKSFDENCGYIEIESPIQIDGNLYSCYGACRAGESHCDVLVVNKATNDYIHTNRILVDNQVLFDPAASFEWLNRSYDALAHSLIAEDVYGDTIKVFLMQEDCDYDIYIGIKCDDGQTSYMYYDTFHLNGIDNVDLRIGSKFLSYANKNSENFSLSMLDNNTTWYTDFGFRETYPLSAWKLKRELTNHTYDESFNFNANVISIHSNGNICSDYVLFGQPENKDGLYNGDSLSNKKIFSLFDYNRYRNYNLSDAQIVRENYASNKSGLQRALFGKMTIEEDKPISAEITGITFTGSSYENGVVTILTDNKANTSLIPLGYGCIIASEDYGFIEYPIRTGDKEYKFYGGGRINDDVLSSLKLYNVFNFATYWKPFTVDVTYFYWNDSVVPTGATAAYDVVRCGCKGEIKNGMNKCIYNGDKYENYYGETAWFDVDGKQYTPVIIDDSDVNFSLTDSIYKFGEEQSDLDNCSLSVYLSSVTIPSFIVKEGVPSEFLTDEYNENFELMERKLSSDVIFADVISVNNISASTTNFTIEFVKSKRTNGVDESGYAEYFTIRNSDLKLPYDSSKMYRPSTDYSYTYYDKVIGTRACIDFNNGNTSIHYTYTDGNKPNYIIGRAVTRENGNTIRQYKIYDISYN